MTSIFDFVKSIPELILDGFSALWDFLKDIVGFLGDVLKEIVSLPLKLIQLLGDLLKSLFVPSDGYFTEKLDTIRAKFLFVDSLSDTVHVFTNFFENNSFLEPPTLTVNLSSGTGTDYGMNSKAIDFSWYKPYKTSVDVLLSSILWVVFAWNTFKDLPGIINGLGSSAHSAAKIDESGVFKDDN